MRWLLWATGFAVSGVQLYALLVGSGLSDTCGQLSVELWPSKSTILVMIEVGQTAPEFTLPDQDDHPVSLSDRDGYAIVYFYPRANTPGCTTEACSFRNRWDAFEDRGVTVFGISDDPVSDLNSFAAEYDLPFHLLSDTDGAVSRAYGSHGEKNIYGNVVEGVFRNTFVVDPDGTIVLTYEGVNPEAHADEILTDLNSLENS